MNKFLNWFFTIYWVGMSIMCFTDTITLTPFLAGLACLAASITYWNNLF